MTEPQHQPRPTTSPNAIVGGVLGGLGFVLNLAAGRSIVAVLLVVAGLVCAVVGLARNEPARGVAAVAVIAAVFTFL